MIQNGGPSDRGSDKKGVAGSGAASQEHGPQDNLPDGGELVVAEESTLRQSCHLLLDRIPAPRLYEAHAFLRFLAGTE